MPGEEPGNRGPLTDTARIDAILSDPPTEAPPEDEPPRPLRWKTSLALFLLTVVSVFHAGAVYSSEGLAGELSGGLAEFLRALPGGYRFAVPLLAILVTHELGHFIAARIHRVDASLPYFLPLPKLSFLGTMGAVISMRDRIRSRNALLDIGASGPLAGMCVALPVLMVGLAESKVGPTSEHGILEGQCLLYYAIKWLVLGRIPDGHDVTLSPMALAGWAGLLLTMLQLFPIAQLDGGHIAYALLGPRQNVYARFVHHGILVVVGINVLVYSVPALMHGAWSVERAGNSAGLLVWYGVVHVVKRLGGGNHPPTEAGDLHPVRKGIAVFSLVLFVLLFMPAPMSSY